MSGFVAVDEVGGVGAPPILTRAREESAQRLIMAYAITGLFFMLLPGTFLGVWNLIRSATAALPPFLQPGFRRTAMRRFSAGLARSSWELVFILSPR